MKKIYINNANQNWICDRLRGEIITSKYSDSFTENPYDADVIWLLKNWVWRQTPMDLLSSKKVVTTIHHIYPPKWESYEKEFIERDRITDHYQVPCQQTHDFIKTKTKKPIFIQPYWGNPKLWFELDKKTVRQKHDLPSESYLVGSFQRDTEGHDSKSPKLEKGPDQFCDIIKKLSLQAQAADASETLEVVLTGCKRQYVINEMKNAGIKYHYFEMAEFSVLNELYNCLDLYVTASRCEGGPQSIIECAANKTPIISTDVGIASRILAKESIFTPGKVGKPNVQEAYKNVQPLLIPEGLEPFISFFESL
jgi:glycosyltransferase involved in cell wall biosynthesis